MQTVSYDRLIEKWAPVLNEESAGTIKDHHRRAVTAAILENQERAFAEEAAQGQFMTEAAPTNNTGNAANWIQFLLLLSAVQCLTLWHMTCVESSQCPDQQA